MEEQKVTCSMARYGDCDPGPVAICLSLGVGLCKHHHKQTHVEEAPADVHEQHEVPHTRDNGLVYGCVPVPVEA